MKITEELCDFAPIVYTSATDNIRWRIPLSGIYRSKNSSFTDETALRGILITNDSKICQGKPIIRGTRISVSHIVELRDELGWGIQKIEDEYPSLTKEQIKAALEYYNTHQKEIDAYLQEEKEVDDKVRLSLLSESSLAKDWLKSEEDEAWKDL